MSDLGDKRAPERIDFVCSLVNYDERRGTFDISLQPDPDKCEWVEIDGKRHLHYKVDGAVFSEEQVAKFATQLVNTPMFMRSPETAAGAALLDPDLIGVQDVLEELSSPLAAIPGSGDTAHHYLQALGVDELDFVILSIDIAGSTKLATQLGRDQYTHLIIIALDEIGAPIPEFNGQVLKYTGDGLIAYFAEPRHAMENDLVLDCALAIRQVVYGQLNDFLQASGFPRIDVRIGIDSGYASIVTLGSPERKKEVDLIGATVSLAAKMQQLAEPGSVLVGEMACQQLQPQWQARCDEMILPGNLEYINQLGEQYRVYNLRLDDLDSRAH